ncbi:putative kinetochore protein [Diplogelasinospora grovesii]|uniref:Kinetochore protein n=1 Tax=Diplogelasinospora grovesii TaxID=303347 RepID=A0AAN6NHM7_9PEZI|nr:putative kinetochore protein [Diplogelasinospora grovesii]
MAPPTVVQLKHDFLTSQTRILSQPLTPTRPWSNSNTSPESGDGLPEKAVEDALFKLNHRLQQHTRRVYPPQATRHVAEQIDALYRGSTSTTTADTDPLGDGRPSTSADLVNEEVITNLPANWSEISDARGEAETETYPAEAKRYAELVSQLQSLAAQRREKAARVARLRHMQGLLQPFKPPAATPDDDGDGDGGSSMGGGGGGGGGGVQENLVTRNGEVEAELQRMRVLLARVSGRVGQLSNRTTTTATKGGPSGTGTGGEEAMLVDHPDPVTADGRRKVQQLLEQF